WGCRRQGDGGGSMSRARPLARSPFDAGQSWHTYRLEAKTDKLRLPVDGVVWLEAHRHQEWVELARTVSPAGGLGACGRRLLRSTLQFPARRSVGARGEIGVDPVSAAHPAQPRTHRWI